jgi:hypothetical protein
MPEKRGYVMRKVYTNENRFFVANARNILESHGIDVFLKNEFVSSAVGEVSPFDSWGELWVTDDADYDKACKIIEGALSKKNAIEWVCSTCNEKNDASFEVCWQCQSEKQ